jgi:hypothetical protein
VEYHSPALKIFGQGCGARRSVAGSRLWVGPVRRQGRPRFNHFDPRTDRNDWRALREGGPGVTDLSSAFRPHQPPGHKPSRGGGRQMSANRTHPEPGPVQVEIFRRSNSEALHGSRGTLPCKTGFQEPDALALAEDWSTLAAGGEVAAGAEAAVGAASVGAAGSCSGTSAAMFTTLGSSRSFR